MRFQVLRTIWTFIVAKRCFNVVCIRIVDLGFGGGKSKSFYRRDGHLGITLVTFASDQSGLKDAVRLVEFFEKENHGIGPTYECIPRQV
ncbi:hypothetical protein LOK49_LG04G00869 [Camellia lanceoleosa]|uniref:Uncharacterized protein n=1 Tax=Camellia lanceoleosa TaxID=1840588 RepID=A0ACC0HXP4_9ERIC|nr:hypothetical protein LOK49_LG04G00869 [Camellia lanceoleosa]